MKEDENLLEIQTATGNTLDLCGTRTVLVTIDDPHEDCPYRDDYGDCVVNESADCPCGYLDNDASNCLVDQNIEDEKIIQYYEKYLSPTAPYKRK